MPAHQAWVHLDEVPLGAGGLKHIVRVDTHQREYLRQLIDEGDVDVALAVLNHLGGFCHFYARCLVCAVDENGVVYFVYQFCHFWRRARRDLQYLLHGVYLVAGVDALRAVTGEEVSVEFKPRYFLHYGQALVLGHARVHRRLIHYNVAFADNLAHHFAGTVQWCQVGIVVAVYGCRHCYDVEVTAFDVLQVCGAAEAVLVYGFLQQIVAHLQGGIVSIHQRFYSCGVHVVAHSGEFCGE